jgi:hypothetical protein
MSGLNQTLPNSGGGGLLLTMILQPNWKNRYTGSCPAKSSFVEAEGQGSQNT